MKPQTVIRDVGPLSTRAEVSSFDVAARTFEIVWSTGAAVLRSTWADGPFFEELSMAPSSIRMGRLTSGTAPFLMDHDGGKVVDQPGVIESARLAGGLGYATVRLAAAGIDPEVDRLFGKIADKIIRNVSVGYRVFKLAAVGDPKAEIPTFRAVDWEPYEVSAVSMGADASAHFRSDSKVTNPCSVPTLTNPRASVRSGVPAMTPEETAALKIKTDAETAANAARALELQSHGEAAVKLDRERTAGITSACRSAKLGDKFAAELIAGKLDLTGARAVVLEELAKRTDATQETPSEGGRVTGVEGEDSRDKFIRGASAWLFEKAGGGVVERAVQLSQTGTLGGNVRHAMQFKKLELDGGEFRGMSLMDLARESLERRGVNTRRMTRNQILDQALAQRDNAYAPTSDFAVLYENVIHKVLLGAYATAEDTWSLFAKTDTVPDFKLSNRYRAGSFGTMDVVAEGAEFKNKGIPDGMKLTIQTETKGNMIALSRQAIINDDMSANADLAARFGRGFRLTIEKEVYGLLLANSGLGPTYNGQPFFHSQNANVNATGSALSVAGLDADRVILGSQKDISGNEFLALRPTILLVPLALGATAKRLNSADYDTDGSKLNQPNVVKGLFQKVIDSPQITGTRRYMFTDPGIAAAIVVAFLEGSGEAPTLQQQLGWRTDGLEYKARMDAKAQIFDPKGAVTNAGV